MAAESAESAESAASDRGITVSARRNDLHAWRLGARFASAAWRAGVRVAGIRSGVPRRDGWRERGCLCFGGHRGTVSLAIACLIKDLARPRLFYPTRRRRVSLVGAFPAATFDKAKWSRAAPLAHVCPDSLRVGGCDRIYIWRWLSRPAPRVAPHHTVCAARVPVVTALYSSRKGSELMADAISERATTKKKHSSAPQPPATDLYNIDSLLTEDERLVRDTVRHSSASATCPSSPSISRPEPSRRDLIPEIAELGLLGMHLDGYGCAGMNAVAYGLACQELEYGDSGAAQLRLGAGLAGDVPDLEVRLRGAEAALAARAWPPARSSAASA